MKRAARSRPGLISAFRKMCRYNLRTVHKQRVFFVPFADRKMAFGQRIVRRRGKNERIQDHVGVAQGALDDILDARMKRDLLGFYGFPSHVVELMPAALSISYVSVYHGRPSNSNFPSANARIAAASRSPPSRRNARFSTGGRRVGRDSEPLLPAQKNAVDPQPRTTAFFCYLLERSSPAAALSGRSRDHRSNALEAFCRVWTMGRCCGQTPSHCLHWTQLPAVWPSSVSFR